MQQGFLQSIAVHLSLLRTQHANTLWRTGGLLALFSFLFMVKPWMILVGAEPATVFTPLQRALPFLLQPTFFVDRIGALCILLTSLALVSGLCTMHAKRALLGGFFVIGLITAPTPIALVVWLFLGMFNALWVSIPQKRLQIIIACVAFFVSILLFSAGAIFGDIRTAAMLAVYLTPLALTAAFVLLFFGAWMSTGAFFGISFFIPVTLVLRFGLSLPVSVPLLLLSVFVMIGALLAYLHMHDAKDAQGFLSASGAMVWVTLPLVMMSSALGIAFAVHSFLFGGLLVCMNGMMGSPQASRLLRAVQAPLPGSVYGMGVFLIAYGIFLLGREAPGFSEGLFLSIVGIFIALYTFASLRFFFRGENGGGQGGVSLLGIMARVVILGGIMFVLPHFFARFLGISVTLKHAWGNIFLPFGTGILAFAPFVLFAVSILALLILLPKRFLLHVARVYEKLWHAYLEKTKAFHRSGIWLMSTIHTQVKRLASVECFERLQNGIARDQRFQHHVLMMNWGVIVGWTLLIIFIVS